AADVGFQVEVRGEDVFEPAGDEVVVAGVADVCLRGDDFVEGDERLDVAEGFFELGNDVAGVDGFVADDAGGAGDEDGVAPDGGARKGWALRAVLLRVVIGAHLPRVFDLDAGLAGGKILHGQASAARADGAGGGEVDVVVVAGFDEGVVASGAEALVALETALVL